VEEYVLGVMIFKVIYCNITKNGAPVAQLVESLRYKLAGRGFDSQWCQWIFSLA
jgi:hypothetical protein